MSYPMLTAIVLSIFAIYAVIVRRHLRARPLIISGLVMMTLTLIFDNVIIGTGIVAYDQSKLSGIMLGYAIRRLLSLIPVFFVVSVLIFAVIHMAPGDPLVSVLPPDASQQLQEQLRKLGTETRNVSIADFAALGE